MRLLPAEYAFRNAGRRPLRTGVAVFSSLLVTAVLAATVAFVRGLERSNLGATPPRTGILLSNASQRDLLRSAIGASVAEIAAADVPGIATIGGRAAVSPEVHLSTSVRTASDPDPKPAVLRGVTPSAFHVHEAVTLVAGRPPRAGEAIAGRLAPTKLGVPPERLAIGSEIGVEGHATRIVGLFHAPGTTIESEIWLPLSDLQSHARRNDLSGVFVRMEREEDLDRLQLFSLRNLDLELLFLTAADYYRELAAWFQPLRRLAWVMAVMIALAALFSGANIQNATVQDRVRELAALRAMGWSATALLVLLLQEALFIAALGALLGLLLARWFVDDGAVSLAMTAFSLRIDAPAILLASAGTLLVTTLGLVPAAVRVLRLPIAVAIQEEN